MTNYIQHQKTADEVVADLDGQITERLARNFGNMTLWHADAATLLRRYREMAGEISTLRAQQETDRATIASLSGGEGEGDRSQSQPCTEGALPLLKGPPRSDEGAAQ